uniref:Transposase MuDR plant domain-containing protein n=1 Tax=Triticum urartu TaxID=4572 RepID=A0A8R7QBB2_TRIUA
MAEFKLALSQHAIKHEFEFNTEKTAPHRFGAYCSRRDEDKCPWRIYASTMEDGCTVMVRKNSCGHDFSSTKRKKKIKNATKRWICEHVKDWLIEDATLGPKALRKKLKEHHGINIKYKRVYMGCSEKKRKSGQHLCPICKDYGHHWHKCKKGNPDDIAAILDVRGPPKKRTKTTKSAQSSIVPCEDDAPSAMRFPPSQILEKTTKEKGKCGKSGSTGAKRSRTQPICGEHDVAEKKTHVAVKVHAKRKSKEVAEITPHLPMVPLDSPAMGTRSKKFNPASPAMSTRSKRRLSL